jgi:DNA-binding LacI/PurR family transcriptional regulator
MCCIWTVNDVYSHAMAMDLPQNVDDPLGYQAIAEELRRRIREGSSVPGSLFPTERELREEFSVSRSTVRRALRALIDSGWAESSPNRGVIAKLGPTPGRSTNVAYVDHGTSIHRHLFFLVGQLLQRQGYHLVHVDSEILGVEGALEYAAEHNFCAAFVWSKKGYPDADRLRRIQSVIPIIAINHDLPTFPTDVVTEDNFGGARLAACHLATFGRKRIAISGMMDMLDINHQRFSGYLMGLFESGLAPAPRDFLFCFTSGMEEPDLQPLIRRLQDPDRPDALFLLQDMFSAEIAEAIAGAGLRIPEDIAVVAFGTDMPLRIGNVGLSVVAIDLEAIAEALVDRFTLRLENPMQPPVALSLPVKLVVRGSCGAPKELWNGEAHDAAAAVATHAAAHTMGSLSPTPAE